MDGRVGSLDGVERLAGCGGKEGSASPMRGGAGHGCCAEELVTGVARRSWSRVLRGGAGHGFCAEELVTGVARRSWSRVLRGGAGHGCCTTRTLSDTHAAGVCVRECGQLHPVRVLTHT
eukprot:361569-Chlamydomonas_euryale.AAC.1